jgi:ubiquinone biosynthesis protein
MTARIELVMLQKTMVVVEGVARKLDPQLNIWSTAEPVVGAWIADNLAPHALLDDVGRGFSSLGAFLANAPRRVEEIASLLEAVSRAGRNENPFEKFALIAGVQYHHTFGDCNLVNTNGNPMAHWRQ